MGRRRLTEQQRQRIARAQARHLARSEAATTEQGAEREGLVIANYGALLDVEDSEGRIWRCTARPNLDELVCGDRVVWLPEGEDGGVVVALQPRRSLLRRPDPLQRLKLVAANIDQILVIAAPQPERSTGLIDRYLVAAELSGITPVIVINKIDALDAAALEALQARLSVYPRIGYRVLYTSASRHAGLDELIAQLKDHTSIFVGHSGVGKSSLIKSLLPEAEVRIGDLSEATGKGRHTTTVTTLYHFGEGGDLIDSPGVREFGLWEVSPEQVAAGFIEFAPFIDRCKFRNCRHRAEPGCALRAAAARGEVSEQRLESYYRIVDSLEER